jgi:hypothetical protein
MSLAHNFYYGRAFLFVDNNEGNFEAPHGR